MDAFGRAVARLCGRLPGRSGLVGYVVCCVLPCRLCSRLLAPRKEDGNKGANHTDPVAAAALLPSRGMRQVLLFGLDGAGKSAFLWLCENPGEECLPGGRLPPTVGAARIMRKAIPLLEEGCRVDLDLCEVGGSEKIRAFWPQFVRSNLNVRVLAFFVSASEPERLAEAASQLVAVGDSLRRWAPKAHVLLVASRPGASPSTPNDLPGTLLAEASKGLEGLRLAAAELVLGGSGMRSSANALLQTVASLAVQ
mmetsp:Transcript_48803/g.145828  ORF Transcript_48803/g.145828 Transcript_48803/m.145828 type:complete len:252 (-) Transcript_48803:40-795(-)